MILKVFAPHDFIVCMVSSVYQTGQSVIIRVEEPQQKPLIIKLLPSDDVIILLVTFNCSTVEIFFLAERLVIIPRTRYVS